MPKRQIQRIYVHCSDTFKHMDIGADDIRKWHMAAPRNWEDIGYHWVIKRNGTIEQGREEHVTGAHVRGDNEGTLGICLVGGKPKFNFKMIQLCALQDLLNHLTKKYPGAVVLGHCDTDKKKTCPTFDVAAWYYK